MQSQLISSPSELSSQPGIQIFVDTKEILVLEVFTCSEIIGRNWQWASTNQAIHGGSLKSISMVTNIAKFAMVSSCVVSAIDAKASVDIAFISMTITLARGAVIRGRSPITRGTFFARKTFVVWRTLALFHRNCLLTIRVIFRSC